jgi:spermidine synthase
MSLDENSWFTEVYPEAGAALSLRTEEKLHEERSAYQKIEVYRTAGFGNLLVLDGFVMLTARDNFIYHEMMTHPALFCHPRPESVLIVGGGDCGCLQEVLKHESVVRVDQAELDERVTRVSERFFPDLCASNDDHRANLHFVDGIRWVEDAAPDSYDVIIVDSTDPIGQAARLFQAPFYGACRRALGDTGVLIVQSESPLLHLDLIKSIRWEMAAAGFQHLKTVNFPQCTYPSGWWSATMAGKSSGLESFRETDASARRFATRYYNASIHGAALAEPEFMRAALEVRT